MTNRSTTILVILAGIAGVVGTLIVTRPQPSIQPDLVSETNQQEQSKETAHYLNTYDPDVNTIGDLIAGIKIVAIKPQGVMFDGKITLTGIYDFSLDNFTGKERGCFMVNTPDEVIKIPERLGQHALERSFCFKDADLPKIKELFGPEYATGRATIVIDQFFLLTADTDGVSEGHLVSVLSKVEE